jgi:hypothetical protein
MLPGRPAARPGRGRGPLGNCSSSDVLPANFKVKMGGDEMESHGWGVTEEKGSGGAASGRGGGQWRREAPAVTEGQAAWRGTDALWVLDDSAVYRCG